MGEIKGLLLDVGGVLLTNGWDHPLRQKTAETFGVDKKEMEERHHEVFDVYERGKITLEEYLKQIIFYEKRPYSLSDVTQFILDEVRPFEEMLALVKELKKHYGLKIGIVSNEGRELAVDRFSRFNFGSFADFFIVSSFVQLRKPDLAIYRLAIDVAQIPPSQLIYIDDRPLLVEIASTLGLKGIPHKNLENTLSALTPLLNLSPPYS